MDRTRAISSLKVGLLAAMAAVAVSRGARCLAQTGGGAPSGQPSDIGGDGGQSAPKSSPQGGAEILSDTQGVDFSDYIHRIRSDIQHNWTPRIPKEVDAPQKAKGVVVIRFTILPKGQIGSMKLEARSGDVALAKAAWYAITDEGQFPPLPKEFHGPQLELRFGFFYNTPTPPDGKKPVP